MPLEPETKQKLQLFLVLAILIAGVRTAYILYTRHAQATQPAAKAAPPLNPDYYVTPKKIYAYDLKSAKELTQQPVWVKEGYRYYYFPYNPATHHADFAHSAGMFLPLQKLEIKDVVLDKAPDSGSQKQLMAIFDQDGKPYAFQVGTADGADYKIFANGMLFIEDPHELYKHWPAETWDAISKHEVKAGMSQMQVIFSVGVGLALSAYDQNNLRYPNGGNPLLVTYDDNRKVTSVKPAPPEQSAKDEQSSK
jgi:hypothetical protein